MNLQDLVKRQFRFFGIDYDGPPRSLSAEEKEFRAECMKEEIAEYVDAECIEDEYDALIDLLIFTLGTMERAGLPLDDGFLEVIISNLQKELGPNTHKRGGFKLDLRKPEGWTPPNLKRVLDDHTRRSRWRWQNDTRELAERGSDPDV